MPINHDRTYFFKFMPADTAKVVLNNESLRWREPRQFNDPFDHQMSFIFPFSHEQLTDLLIKETMRLVYDDDQTVLEETLLSKAIQVLRLSKNGIPKDEVVKTITDGAVTYENQFDEYQSNINSLITGCLNKSRVLCVTETNENVVMWSHYANEHRGVCLRLECIDEVDNTLLIAKPVCYQDTFPVFPTAEEFVRHLTGEKLIEFSKLLFEIPYVKHQDWSYEKEWRVYVPNEPTHSACGYDDWKENPRVFGAIYLGCRIDSNEAAELIYIIEQKYPHMEIYQAKQSINQFAIEYEQLK